MSAYLSWLSLCGLGRIKWPNTIARSFQSFANKTFDNLVIKVRGKGNKYRLVPFSLECRKLLFRYLSRQESRFVFATRIGLGFGKRNVGRDMTMLGKKLRITGVRFSPHTLRHTFAVTFLRNGGDVYVLSRILGHANITTTTVYLRSMGIDAMSEAHQKFSPLVVGGGTSRRYRV